MAAYFLTLRLNILIISVLTHMLLQTSWNKFSQTPTTAQKNLWRLEDWA